MDLGGAIGHKGDAICGHICIKSRCEHFLSIVDKNLRAEPVQDQTKLDPAMIMIDRRAPLMDDRSAGSGELAVDLDN